MKSPQIGVKKVSIIIPMYMCETYVEDFLGCLCNQDYPNIEMLCCVDGSPDSTLTMVKEAAVKDDRIRVLSLSHQGAGSARNAGIEASTGDYMMFLDVDDAFPEDYISRMVDAAEEMQVDVAVCQFITKDYQTGLERSGTGFKANRVRKKVMKPEEVGDLFNTISTVSHNKIFQGDLVRTNHLTFSGTHGYNDVVFVTTALVCASRIGFLNEDLYTYRRNHNVDSITTTRHKNREEVVTVFSELYSWLKERKVEPLYQDTFCRKWRSSLRLYARLGRDKEFIQKTAEYIACSEPFSSMSQARMETEAGIMTAVPRVRLLLMKRKKKGEKEIQRRIKEQAETEIYNMKEIRKELNATWGKKLPERDSFFRGLFGTLSDIGIRKAADIVYLIRNGKD